MTGASKTPGEPAELDALLALAWREIRAGRLDEAVAACRQILAIRPDVAEAHNALGIILAQQNQLDQATKRFEQAIALRPGYTEAHNNLGNVLLGQGKLDEAATRYQQALALRPDYAQAHNNLGNVLLRQGKLDEAAARYQQALALRPDLADALYNLGNILGSQGKLDEAAARFRQALALRPDYSAAHNNLGNVLLGQGKLDEAAAHYQQALTLRPDYIAAHNNLGNVLLSQGKLDEAAARYEQALALRPDLAETQNNLAYTLKAQGKLDDAAARCQQALALRPDYAEAHHNLGVTLRAQGRLDEAAIHYQQALALRPDYADAQMGLATCYLVEEDYQRGWPAYEARLRVPGLVPKHSLPHWTGEPLAGRSLLLLAEQGLGDTLQFVRYARLLKARGARVVLACQKALGRLLESQADSRPLKNGTGSEQHPANPDRHGDRGVPVPIFQHAARDGADSHGPDWDELFILGSAGELPRSDFCLPLLSAPGALGTDASTIPHEVPYLWADPELTAQWRRELAAIEGFKIGIVWQGSRGYHLDRWRSVPLAQFAPLARLPGVRLVSLQKGFGSEQIATVDFPVVDLSSRLDEAAGPFMDTAAVIGNLDLVVSPDSAIGHLAGALGAPVWLALQFSPNWRWQLERDDSPWYPTMRLFRQTRFGQWSDVFERMANAVEARRSETP
jgi:Tfp pilus assembly protein PilF